MLIAKSNKNPYSIDAILRTPTAALGGAASTVSNSPNSSIKRKLLDDDSDRKTEATSPVKIEKKLKIEDTSEEELNVVKDEDND